MGTVFYAFKIKGDSDGNQIKNIMSEITEHLSMNGYTFNTDCESTLFIYEDEFNYVETILEDRNIDYIVL